VDGLSFIETQRLGNDRVVIDAVLGA